MSLFRDKYNGLVHTFIAEPLINIDWNAAYDQASGVGVTLGTDDWQILAAPGEAQEQPLYNRLGASGDRTFVFDPNDKGYLLDFTVFCNFADGLVDVSNRVGNAIPSPIGDSAITNKLLIRLNVYNIAADGTQASLGTIDFPVNAFNEPYALANFEPRNNVYPSGSRGWYFTAKLLRVTQPLFSTKSISTDFQSDNALVWATFTIAHTFGTVTGNEV
jgi:hypothetical protein